MFELIQILGLLGFVFANISWLPQIIKARRTRSTKDISMQMLGLILVGLSLIQIYTIIINKDFMYIIGNFFGMSLISLLMGEKYWIERPDKRGIMEA